MDAHFERDQKANGEITFPCTIKTFKFGLINAGKFTAVQLRISVSRV